MSCGKDELSKPIDSSEYIDINITFDNVFDTADLVLNDGVYSSDFEELFTIRRFNYFVSNFEFIDENNVRYAIPQDSSYFLIKEGDVHSYTCRFKNVPNRKYTAMKFVIGVDSLRSTMGIEHRTGVLDVGGYASDMAWTWNQGYIFLKLEMFQYKSKGDTSAPRPFIYHIGGYGGTNTPSINNIRETTLTFPRTIDVSKNADVHIQVKADASKVINGTTKIEIEKYQTVMLTPFSSTIADNYKDMFSIKSLE